MAQNTSTSTSGGPAESGSGKQTPLTRALGTIRTLRRRLAEQEGTQPVAVVGIGLRLPGGIGTLDSYWEALAAGRDLVGPLPEERKGPFADAWKGLPQRGGFLDGDVLDFDAEFFGISPREARHLDPQHRLLLEVTWEALENAGIPATSLGGTSAGVYLGIMWQDYREWLEAAPDAYATTGNGHNFAAGRIAYALGLQGPAVAVDTACSSSLVAVHLAAQALRRGECEIAFAAGANLIMSARSMRLVHETRSLSPDGLCRTFDARANGFVRGEGCGALVLKRLDHALRDGDRVHAVLHGTAVNQDGRSGGFTAPNVLSQVSLIETALERSGLEPRDIGYVEAHGTGTSLGDPIEMEALATALGRRNGGAPLPVGAVKTTFGHLESAAGVAGLVKAVLCLRHRQVPPLVHFRTLNPRIDLSGTGITVPERLLDWPERAGRYAAVSSFGMSGTNAQVVLGPAPEPVVAADAAPVTGFGVSARNTTALRELAARYVDHLASDGRSTGPDAYAAFARTATYGRAELPVRARITAADADAARAALRALAAGEPHPGVEVGEAGASPVEAVVPSSECGTPDDTDTAVPAPSRQVVDLPTYPWQRERYAPEQVPVVAADAPAADGREESGLPVRHEVVWETAGPVDAVDSRHGAGVVVAGDDEELRSLLVAEAAVRGMRGMVLAPAPVAVPEGWTWARLPDDAEGWDGFWATAEVGPAPLSLLLAPAAPAVPRTLAEATDAPDPVAATARLCAGVTGAVAALARAGGGHRAYVLTRGALRVEEADRTALTGHGPLHGLAPVLGLELGTAWGGVVDLPAGPAPQDARAVLDFAVAQTRSAALGGAVAEDTAAVRAGTVRVARLRTVSGPRTQLPVRGDATYLVTGGLGAVGRELTTELADRGARHLLLVGRRAEAELPADAVSLLATLRGDGVEVVYRGGGCDTPEALAAIDAALTVLPPLAGIVHAAGTLHKSPAAGLTAEDFAAALSAKAGAAWWLHLAFAGRPLDFFVLVSSVSALWGTEHCAAYSAANGALDALAAHRAGLGLPAVSLAYGPWALAGAGMADTASLERFARMGVGALTSAAGRAALTGAATGSPAAHVVACPLDLPRLAGVLSGLRPRGLFAGASSATGDTAQGAEGDSAREAAPESEPSVVAELAALPPKALPDAVRSHVLRLLAAQLGHADPGALRLDVGFLDLGLDSIMAVDLAVRLSAAFGTQVLAADVFDHPTAAELSALLLERIRGERPAGPEIPHPVPSGTRPALTTPTPATVPAIPTPTTPDTTPHPIAIVGMAGRFPQADSVEELWDLLREGRDGVGTVPEGRWDRTVFHTDTGDEADAVGSARITTDQGGFLRDVDRFDASFFDIPAREAEHLDPQQRLLLESVWHALEDARIDPRGLKGSRTGVFVGISYADYARLLARGGPERVDAYYSTGTALNAAAGRIAFTLGLRGPAMAVDTACSSSLVALHLAVRSLRAGESDAVLAGGVNLLLDPVSSVAVSRAHMLSPDGRCRTFAAGANGFVRSEGCGMLVLKRLADARRDGDRVLALIRGTAVNQDGMSSGLTAPNGRAQEEMLTAALADAGVAGAHVSYLEAHGTGTALGDPIELRAAWRVLGPGRRPGEPLHVGSVKSNVGHCESAAGVVGVVKTVQALRHGVLPANLHFDTPNPQVPWADMNVRVVDAPLAWRAGDGPRIAGISGFGFTGTNAHVILSEAPVDDRPTRDVPEDGRPEPLLVPLSAPDAAGLERLADSWERWLTQAPQQGDPATAAATAGVGRAHFPYRRALFGRDREQLLTALRGERPPARPVRAPRIAFLFSGQGSQYYGMGRELYETEPVFRDVFDACDRDLAPVLGASLADLTLYGADRAAIGETRVTQPALVTLGLALTALWESWGVTPAVVMGHSVGEITAAVCAGVMDRATGLELIAHRAGLMQDTERGAMLAVAAPEERVREWTEGRDLDVAAVNGPEAAVVSGPPEPVSALAAELKAQGVRVRALTVSHAFHSRLLDPALPVLEERVRALRFGPAQLPIVSNVTGRLAEADTYGAEYWCRHARSAVRFHDGVREVARLGVDLCLEIGPDRTLVNLVRAGGLLPDDRLTSSLRRGAADRASLLTAAKVLYEHGQDLAWDRVYPRATRPRGDAPRYPFARARHWTPLAAAPAGPAQAPASVPAPGAPAWGTELRSPALRGRVFSTERSTVYPPHLTDHRLFGTVSVPGASQTATVLSALGAGGVPVALEDLHFPRALVLHDGERYELQIIEAQESHGTRTVSVQSLVDPEQGRWQEHLAARVVPGIQGGRRPAPDRDTFTAAAERRLTGAEFYSHLRSLGYHLGPSFRWIAEAWLRGDEALVRFAEPAEMNEDPAGYEIHPGLLDSCLQSTVVFAVGGDAAEAAELSIPFAAARLEFPGRPGRAAELWGHVRAVRRRRTGDFQQVESADLHLFDAAGSTVLAVDGFRFRSAPRALLERSLRQGVRHAYELTWAAEEAVPEEAAAGLTVGVLGAEEDAGSALCAALTGLGHHVVAVTGQEPAGPDTDLLVDARFCAPPDPDGGSGGSLADAALAASWRLAASLRSAPTQVPYVVLGTETPDGTPDVDAAPMRDALFGLVASLAAEQPGRPLLRITLADGWTGPELARVLTRATVSGTSGAVLRVGAGTVHLARLTPCHADDGATGPEGTADGAALITGGLGALGLSCAVFLARRGVRVITLMGRSAPDTAAQAVIDELTAGGTLVEVVSGDVTDPGACRAAVAAASRHLPLRTVLHLAGTNDDHAFERQTPASFEAVFAAKARGAVTLARALRDHRLDAFLLGSSASAVLGSAGQANYAAANGFLAGLAEWLRARGVPATSVDWGPWAPRAKGGLAATEATARAIDRLGIRPLSEAEAGELLGLALGGRRSRLVAVAVAPDAGAAAPAGHPMAALLAAPARQRTAAEEKQGGRRRGWLREALDGLAAGERETHLLRTLRSMTGEVLGDATQVDDDSGFGDMGVDSIMAIDLRGRLAAALDHELPATVAFDHPSIARLAAHVLGVLHPEPANTPAPAPAPAPAPRPQTQPHPQPAPPSPPTHWRSCRSTSSWPRSRRTSRTWTRTSPASGRTCRQTQQQRNEAGRHGPRTDPRTDGGPAHTLP
ncbi:polyketide synthase [Streptomyces chrestomyceticus JCM 4735]|uniref:Polyketide synthase n=1 Tax=Streptomyces chrestomyceticus JCM 4735 TaxID=1306181 RepID=A0A7U9Q083_9ACTN|nr:type I polyketide synthase [Streptomyces chrestomyceticus]GCD39307.1 polyketide synthase [Streptomyces chrestomyceticus JCM 4735]